jgi:hypothetical protein
VSDPGESRTSGPDGRPPDPEPVTLGAHSATDQASAANDNADETARSTHPSGAPSDPPANSEEPPIPPAAAAERVDRGGGTVADAIRSAMARRS